MRAPIALLVLAMPAFAFAQEAETQEAEGPEVETQREPSIDDPTVPSVPDEPLDEGAERELDQLMLSVLPALEPPAEPETLETLELEPPAEAPVIAATAEERPPAPFWGTERQFVSGMVDLGFLFLEPRFHLGYGVPHQTWIGAELDPILSGSGIGVYGGVRGAVPWGDLRLGARYRFNWTRSFLEALDGYDNLQYRDRTGPNANYLSLEAQLSLYVPIDSMAFTSEITATYVVPFEQGSYTAVYEDSLHIITVAPGWVWSASVGWRFRFGPEDAIWIEPQVELAHIVSRDAFVVRVGLEAGIRLWPDLDVRLMALPAVYAPDNIGAGGGNTFHLGLRYRWATDAPRFGG